MDNTENIVQKILKPLQDSQAVNSGEVFGFVITGMNCTGCANSIKTYLQNLEGISNVEINFASEFGEVTFDQSMISKDKIKKEINNCLWYFPNNRGTSLAQKRLNLPFSSFLFL